MRNDLGKFFLKNTYNNPISLGGISESKLVDFFKKMTLIRKTELKVADLIRKKVINCPCHLCVGQEGISGGILSHFKKGDTVFGNHRSHGHYLALGGNIKKFFFELQGKKEGCSKGMGGSMHLIDEKVGFSGSAPIVAGTIPLALGSALNNKILKNNNVSYAFFGDGACEEGVVHESLNLASLYKLPIVFIVENNLFSSHLDVKDRQPSNSMARFAKANCIKNFTIDGNDVVKVSNTILENIKNVRNGNGPLFIECVTYRWLGHVGPNDDIDVGVMRSKEQLESWKKKDPILRLKKSLVLKKILNNEDQNKIETKIENMINKIVSATLKVKIDTLVPHHKFL